MSPRDAYRVADQRRADHRAHLAKHGAAGGGMNGVGVTVRRMGDIITADHAAKDDLHPRTRRLAEVHLGRRIARRAIGDCASQAGSIAWKNGGDGIRPAGRSEPCRLDE